MEESHEERPSQDKADTDVYEMTTLAEEERASGAESISLPMQTQVSHNVLSNRASSIVIPVWSQNVISMLYILFACSMQGCSEATGQYRQLLNTLASSSFLSDQRNSYPFQVNRQK